MMIRSCYPVLVLFAFLLSACMSSNGLGPNETSLNLNQGIITVLPSPLPSTQPSSQPTSSPSPTPSPSPPENTIALDSEEQAFITLINTYRTQSGKPILQVSVTLTQASKWLSTDMANNNYLDHYDSMGRDPFVRMAAFMYRNAYSSGENIAAGNSTAKATFAQWKSSSGHNANMLASNYLAIGVGRATNSDSDYGWYWTTNFGSTIDAVLK